MIIRRITIEGFRAFNQPRTFDFAKDVIIFAGPNGRGKTSLLDAILWAFTGSVKRLVNNEDSGRQTPPHSPIISLYSQDVKARVEMELVDASDETTVSIIRSLQHQSGGVGEERSRLQVRIVEASMDKSSHVLENEEADSWLVNKLWPEAKYAEDSSVALVRALTRSIYLQQDRVRQFLEMDQSADRFRAISELVGAGRIDELRDELRSNRSTRQKELRELNEKLDDLKTSITDLEQEYEDMGPVKGKSLDQLREDWATWWNTAGSLGIDSDPPALDASDAGTALDQAVKQLAIRRRSVSNRREDVLKFLAAVRDQEDEPDLPDLDELERELKGAREAQSKLEQKLEDARKQAAERRKQQTQERERGQELATLATLASRHIEGKCPVCQQDHSIEDTRAHLQKLQDAVSVTEVPAADTGSDVDAITEELAETQATVAEKETEYESARQQHERHERWLSRRKQRLDELDLLDEDETPSSLSNEAIEDLLVQHVSSLEDQVDALRTHVDTGEELAVDMASLERETRREEIEEELKELRKQHKSLREHASKLESTIDMAADLVKGLQEASTEVISKKLSEVRPLLRGIYSKVDPHPTFRDIRFDARYFYQKGRVNPLVEATEDPGIEEAVPPFDFMSSSQVNVVALSIFLAMNLGLKTIPLDTVILDDPLQSLDDINLLGFVDLLRRIRDHGSRQILVSTHDPRLAALLERKLRPVRKTQETHIVNFVDWTRSGPDTEFRILQSSAARHLVDA